VDASKVQASFDNGVLTLTIPKDSSQARSRRVQVRSGSGSAGQAADQGQQGAQSAEGGTEGKSGDTHH
jgi:HSP20 family protein